MSFPALKKIVGHYRRHKWNLLLNSPGRAAHNPAERFLAVMRPDLQACVRRRPGGPMN